MKNNDSVTLNSFQALGVLKKSLEVKKAAPSKPKSRFNQVKEALQQLEKQHPLVFNAQKPLPLAIGIEKQIRKEHPLFSVILLRSSLAVWTRQEAYLLAVIAHNHRHNLDGSVATIIQESEKEYSKGKLSSATLLAKP